MEVNTLAANGFLYNPKANTVLLHLRDNHTPHDPNVWSFFGGSLERDESPLECFIRELAEEITLEVPLRAAHHLRTYERSNDEGAYTQHTFYVVSEIALSDLRLTEGADMQWVDLSRAFACELSDDARSGLRLFMETYKREL